MKLLIARDTDDDLSRFAVYNSDETLLLKVRGKENSTVRRVKAFDSDGNCVIKISATPEIGGTVGYNIVTAEGVFGVTVKFKSKEFSIKIHGNKLFFKGNILTRSFEITDVSTKTIAIHKPEAGKSGCYTLEVFDTALTLSLLSVAICVDLLSFSDSAVACRV